MSARLHLWLEHGRPGVTPPTRKASFQPRPWPRNVGMSWTLIIAKSLIVAAGTIIEIRAIGHEVGQSSENLETFPSTQRNAVPFGFSRAVDAVVASGRRENGDIVVRPIVTFGAARTSGLGNVQHSPVASIKTVHMI